MVWNWTDEGFVLITPLPSDHIPPLQGSTWEGPHIPVEMTETDMTGEVTEEVIDTRETVTMMTITEAMVSVVQKS